MIATLSHPQNLVVEGNDMHRARVTDSGQSPVRPRWVKELSKWQAHRIPQIPQYETQVLLSLASIDGLHNSTPILVEGLHSCRYMLLALGALVILTPETLVQTIIEAQAISVFEEEWVRRKSHAHSSGKNLARGANRIRIW